MHNNDKNNATYTLRDVKNTDFDGILDLYRLAIEPLWKLHGRDYDMERVSQNIIDSMETPSYFMKILVNKKVESESDPVAYFAWEKHQDHTSKHIIAHLRMILINPDFRREGIGSYMIKEFEHMAKQKGCTKILFDVLVNSPANKFYESLGYDQWSNFMEKKLF
jgi:ribosomal protein S18 acetylase RimI-like enzyme